MSCGISGLGAGMAIGIVGDAGVRAVGQQEKLFVVMILVRTLTFHIGTLVELDLDTDLWGSTRAIRLNCSTCIIFTINKTCYENL